MRDFLLIGLSTYAVVAGSLAGCGGDDHSHSGVADALAEEACAAWGGATTAVTASEDATGAEAIVLNPGTAYAVTIPASGTGHLTFNATHEHYDWAFFLEDPAELHTPLEHLETTLVAHIQPPARNGACPSEAMHDHRAHIDPMGLFLVQIHAAPGATVWFLILGEASDHH
jgi:hypothetical protein